VPKHSNEVHKLIKRFFSFLKLKRYINGESYADVLVRLSTLHNQLMSEWAEKDYQDTTILMICHAHTIACFDTLLLGKSISNANHASHKMANCTIRVYEKRRGASFTRTSIGHE
jgi:broad specificity phosphatase PhoE